MHRALIHLAVATGLSTGLATLVGCRGGDAGAPPCGAVGAKFLALVKDDLTVAKVDERTRSWAVTALPSMRDSLALACTEGKWTAAVRSCMVKAQSHVELEACEQQLTEDQRRGLDRSARGEPDESR